MSSVDARWGLRGAFLSIALGALGASCSSGPLRQAGDASARDGGGDVPAESPSRLASNGVPIPSLETAPPEPCGALGVELRSCASGPCEPIDCACSTGAFHFDTQCFEDQCISGISCAAVCAAKAEPVDQENQAVICAFFGVCAEDTDCKMDERCVRSAGQAHGQCSKGLGGGLCYRDADCVDSACVVGADHLGSCASGEIGSPCNLDGHCFPGSHCWLREGAFAGQCSDGIDNSPCAVDGDCALLHVCLSFGASHLCSFRSTGSPCNGAADCNSGFCVAGKCGTGEPGADCRTPADCQLPFCVRDVCMTGAPGAECYQAADCQNACVMVNPPGTCSDGKLGSSCPPDLGLPSGCQAGLHCERGGNGATCVAAGIVGQVCRADADCISKNCGGLPDSPGAVCSEGKLGQRCHGTNCQAGLRCASDGLVGICVAGAAGDPCGSDGDCVSGTCGAPIAVNQAANQACFGRPDLTPCGGGGACSGSGCFFTRTCVAGDGGVAHD